MAATDGQIILAASRFGDITPVYLKDFAKTELPTVAKIVKGQHQNLGVPTLSNPSLQSTALFLNAGKKYQILAQPIKIKEGRKPINVGSKILIPETYPGYFELLSEDGRSTRCIDNVLDLSKKPNLRVLVRETFRCNHLSKTVHAGEILTTLYDNGKYLKCKTLKDEIINLPLEAKAKFSPIAKEDSISGVHSVKNLLKKRMPVIVRLVYGSAPKGLKQPFIPELRLLGCIEVDRVFALPLQKDTDLVSVPLNAKIKLQRSKNMEQLQNFMEYSRFLEKALKLLSDARDRLQIIDVKLSDKDNRKDTKCINGGSNSSSRKITNIFAHLENGFILRKSASSDSTSKYIHQQHNFQNQYQSPSSITQPLHQQQLHQQHQQQQQQQQHQQQQLQQNQTTQQCSDVNTNASDYDEIDQIYDYVRGFAPLPKNLNRFEHVPEPTNIHISITNKLSNDKSQPDSGNYSFIKNSSNSMESNRQSNYYQHHHYTNNSISNNNNINNNNNNNNNNNSNNNCNSNTSNNNNNVNNANNMNNNNNNNNSNNNTNNNNNNNNNSNTGNNINSNNANNNKNNFNINNINNHHKHSDDLKPPVPPPIETIPGKKLPEKRQRPTLPKLYVKNNSSNQNKLSSPPNGNTTAGAIIINGKDGIESQSPLFHIRYKSLSNLQLTPDSTNSTSPPLSTTQKGQDKNHSLTKSASTQCAVTAPLHQHHQPREGTLDSSRSGGRTSGDSKLPEKKTRRLSRPRSLSNLVWDLRPHKEKSKKKLYIHHFDHRQQGTLYL